MSLFRISTWIAGDDMPLHDWTDDAEWDNLHQLWISRLFYDIKARLPDEFRAYLGSAAGLSVSAKERPNMGVRQWLAAADAYL